MDRIRILAGCLLCADGIVHLARPGLEPFGPTFNTTALVFGVVYLIVGVLLLVDARGARMLGAAAPIVGLVVGLFVGLLGGPPGGPPGFNPVLALLAALDVAVVVACGVLVTGTRPAARTPAPPASR